MNTDELLSRYFDDALTKDEHQQLQDWLKSSPGHMREFSRMALLHDQLRGEHLAQSALTAAPPTGSAARPASGRWRRIAASVGVVVTLVVFLLLSLEIGTSSVSAATELRRIIAAQDIGLDRSYQIVVEETDLARRPLENSLQQGRPPKPPLDGAVLHVRSGNQFVLIRQMPDGGQFLTGSNGRESWAIRPDGPVRVSTDLADFSRDLPGHEHNMPLLNIKEGLSQLAMAYTIELLPIETAEQDSDPSRLLVGVKKPGFRGPRRVEMTYVVQSGEIRQLRFIEMPYGPEKLTIRLTLLEESHLGERFFDHEFHHAADMPVVEE